VATPLLHHGYHLALLMGASIVAAAAASAALLRVGFPHRMPAADEHQAAADA
jgi:hypothetical protein